MPILTNVKRVLILRCGALGDLVYATSVIDALRAQYGEDIIIDFITTPGTAKLFEFDPRVNQTFLLKHKKFPIWLSPQKRAIIRHSEQNPYDLFINFETGKQFLSLSKAIRAKHKTGWFFSNPDFSNATHMVDICKSFYASIVEPDILKNASPRIIGKSFTEVQSKLNLPEEFIVLSPSNSHNKKSRLNYRAWPQSHWKTLIALLPKHLPVIMVGGKGEEPFFSAIKPYPSHIIDLVGKTSISEMIAIIDQAKALVVTDTGTAHIASALNTPIFCLIGPTPANVTGPYQSAKNEVHILSANLPCSPCYKTEVMKQCNDNICMSQITPKMVLFALTSHTIFSKANNYEL
ncbi:MAG: glycosyltransferase family 9 protein [Sulfuricurvum sp.]|jgi:ADP-heptose:LPS heptosyltransferase